MNKIICDVCGTAYPETASQCPICGSARRAGNKTVSDPAGNREAPVARTHTKGGHFSNANVRKRNRANQAAAAQNKKISPQKDGNDGSNHGLVVVASVLLAAIVLVLAFIIIKFVLPMSRAPKQNNENMSTGSTSTAAVSTTAAATSEASVPCTNLTLSSSEITLDAVGRAWLLDVKTEPKDTTDVVTFASSDEKVATVTAQGRVTAVGAGNAVITVTCGSVTRECRVNCEIPEATTVPTATQETTVPETSKAGGDITLSIDHTDVTLFEKGETFRISAGDLSNAQITWSSDNPSIASVDNGKVTAVSSGTTTIRAEYNGQKASCIVRCSFDDENTSATEEEASQEPSGELTISNVDVTISVDESFTLTLRDGDGNRASVTWTTDDDSVCTVSGDTVTGVGSGMATVSAEYNGSTYSCIVRVK